MTLKEKSSALLEHFRKKVVCYSANGKVLEDSTVSDGEIVIRIKDPTVRVEDVVFRIAEKYRNDEFTGDEVDCHCFIHSEIPYVLFFWYQCGNKSLNDILDEKLIQEFVDIDTGKKIEIFFSKPENELFNILWDIFGEELAK